MPAAANSTSKSGRPAAEELTGELDISEISTEVCFACRASNIPPPPRAPGNNVIPAFIKHPLSPGAVFDVTVWW
jgi:hypothetical protein